MGAEAIPLLLFGAVGIALVAFAEAVGPANEFAREHGGKIDPNRELIAIGAANTGAGLFTGFPIGSSLSKSAANDRAGAHTPASLVIAAAATALVAVFLTPLFEPLPEATLGAIVVVAVFGMMKVGKLRRLWELRRIDFWLAMIALAGVLVVPTLEALGIAVVASLAVLVWRASEGRVTFLGRAVGGLEPVDLEAAPEAAIPGLIIVRPDEMLFFANVASVRDGIMQTVETAESRPAVVLLDLSLTPEVDVPVVEALEDLHQRLAADGIELWLAYLRPEAKDLLERAGVLAIIGDGRVHARVVDAILAFAPSPAGRRRAGRGPDGPAGVHPEPRRATGHERRGGGDPGRARTAPGGRACRRGRDTRTSLTPIARAGRRAATHRPTRLRSSARARVPATAAHDALHGQVVAQLHEVGTLSRLEAAPVGHAEERQRLARGRRNGARQGNARTGHVPHRRVEGDHRSRQVAAVGQHAAVALDDALEAAEEPRACVRPAEGDAVADQDQPVGRLRPQDERPERLADVVPVGDQLDVGVVLERARRRRAPGARWSTPVIALNRCVVVRAPAA